MFELKNTHHLTEVLCGFWFNPNSNVWDSTFFGKFYEKIKVLGYTEKEEQKGVQIKFELKPKDKENTPSSEMKEIESRMVFRNKENSSAIIMAANFISFHKLEPYENWEALISKQVIPGMNEYLSLGLSNEIVQVQALYLNRYNLQIEEKLSDYFNFIPSINSFGNGIESNLVFQSQYELEPNLMQQIKLNSILDSTNKIKNVALECSCFAYANKELGWEELATQAHDQNNIVFKSITKK